MVSVVFGWHDCCYWGLSSAARTERHGISWIVIGENRMDEVSRVARF